LVKYKSLRNYHYNSSWFPVSDCQLSLEGDGTRGTKFQPMNPEAIEAGERRAAMVGGEREPHHVQKLLVCVACLNSEGLSIWFVEVIGEVRQVYHVLGLH
jgi:hypothetical protein